MRSLSKRRKPKGGGYRGNESQSSNEDKLENNNTQNEDYDSDKYEKNFVMKQKKQEEFIYGDLSKVKMYTLIIISLSFINLIFVTIYKEVYKL